jgi:hypothetical protein
MRFEVTHGDTVDQIAFNSQGICSWAPVGVLDDMFVGKRGHAIRRMCRYRGWKVVAIDPGHEEEAL